MLHLNITELAEISRHYSEAFLGGEESSGLVVVAAASAAAAAGGGIKSEIAEG